MVVGEDEAYVRAIVDRIDRVADGRSLDISPDDTALGRAIRRHVGSGPLVTVGYPEGARVLTLEQLAPYPDQHFDLIFGCFPAPPQQPPIELVQRCKRVLKSGGRLLLDVPVHAGTGASPPPEGEPREVGLWRRALEGERLWVDLAATRTPKRPGHEYMGVVPGGQADSGHGTGDTGAIGPTGARPGIDRAILTDHWYLTVSGLK